MNIRIVAVLTALLWPLSTLAEDELLVTFKALTPEIAFQLAQATMKTCRKEGYQVAVAVVNRSGIIQVLLRDQRAGPHTLDAAQRKAWTAASFRADTQSIAGATRPGDGQSGARFITGAMMVGGFLPLYAEGTVIGAVGVSGSPTADRDRKCAETAAEALEDMMLF